MQTSSLAVPRKEGDFFGSHEGSSLSDISEREKGRITKVGTLIPGNVTSVLDVGCGDGRIVKSLEGEYQSFGIDFSKLSAKNFGPHGICGSSLNLPFGDHSVDLVMCCEVLEHFPESMFWSTLEEIQRVAGQYILISVPFKEDLDRGNAKCPACECVFNIWGHLRSFTNSFLDEMFSNFQIEKTEYFGVRHPYMNKLVLKVNQQYGNRWNWVNGMACPECGNESFPSSPRSLTTIVCGAINLLSEKLLPVQNTHWVFKRYVRKE